MTGVDAPGHYPQRRPSFKLDVQRASGLEEPGGADLPSVSIDRRYFVAPRPSKVDMTPLLRLDYVLHDHRQA